MKICFKDKKLHKLCENSAKLKAKYGKIKSRRIIMRIGDLMDATNLYDISKLPQARLHLLQNNRKDQFAVDTLHPFRMILIPLDGSKNDIRSITSVEIISINEDYH